MATLIQGKRTMTGPPLEALPAHGIAQPALFPERATWTREAVTGDDLAFECFVADGRYFFCKGDRNNRPVRATELILTQLAERLGLRTAPCAVIEHDGETYFGSQQEISSADQFKLRDFLKTPRLGELGQPATFPGEYIAQVLAFDLFVGNPDRGPHNFLLVKDGALSRICAIDFAACRLSDLTTDRFPVADTTTIKVGKLYRQIHGEHASSAVDMIDRIEALPAVAFSRIVAGVPDGWLTGELEGDLNAVWGSPNFRNRLARLRAGLGDGTLV